MNMLRISIAVLLPLWVLSFGQFVSAQDVSGYTDIYYDPQSVAVYAEAHTWLDSSIAPSNASYDALIDLAVITPSNTYEEQDELFFGYAADAYITVYPSEEGWGDYSAAAEHGVHITGFDEYFLSDLPYQGGDDSIDYFVNTCDPECQPRPVYMDQDVYFAESEDSWDVTYEPCRHLILSANDISSQCVQQSELAASNVAPDPAYDANMSNASVTATSDVTITILEGPTLDPFSGPRLLIGKLHFSTNLGGKIYWQYRFTCNGQPTTMSQAQNVNCPPVP